MARDFEAVEKDLRAEDEGRTLREEAKEARSAGRALEDGPSAGARELREIVAQSEQMAARMEEMLAQMESILGEVTSLKADMLDINHAAQQAALNGVNMAQEEAARITLKNIGETTAQYRQYIQQWETESRQRIEALSKATAQGRFNRVHKWIETALIVILTLLAHAAWQALT